MFSPLLLPPLRERPGDIPRLAAHFAKQVAGQNGWKPKAFTPEAMESYSATRGRAMCANCET